MKSDHPLQRELDDVGIRLGWRRGAFRSWKVRSYTVAVSAGEPKRIVISKGGTRSTAKDVDELLRLLRVSLPATRRGAQSRRRSRT